MESPIEVVQNCAAWSDDMAAGDPGESSPTTPSTTRSRWHRSSAGRLSPTRSPTFIRPGPPGIESIEFRLINIAADGPVVMTERVDAFKLPDKSFELPVMGTFEVNDGKINAWRDYFDLNQFLSQMGDHPLQAERRREA